MSTTDFYWNDLCNDLFYIYIYIYIDTFLALGPGSSSGWSGTLRKWNKNAFFFCSTLFSIRPPRRWQDRSRTEKWPSTRRKIVRRPAYHFIAPQCLASVTLFSYFVSIFDFYFLGIGNHRTTHHFMVVVFFFRKRKNPTNSMRVLLACLKQKKILGNGRGGFFYCPKRKIQPQDFMAGKRNWSTEKWSD